ncbi:hypothetical protein [Vibrio sp. SSH13-20]|uniref:hypothetical protein n=1 Tax=Vibrio sp. SSH13-20 TaxID=3136668 RepID=UPI0032C48E6E
MSSEVGPSQTGDVAIDEINYYLSKYEKRRDGFYYKHKLTRRLSILSVFWIAISIGMISSKAVFGIDLITLVPYQFVGFDVVNWHLIVFWPAIIFFLSMNNLGTSCKAIFLLEFAALLVFYSKPAIVLLAIVHTTIFVTCYALNRMNGYTRGWSRNRLATEHLERLKREYLIAINGQSDEFIRIERDNTLAKLSEIDTKNREAAHADIVGDYIAVHDGAFGWIKGLRK